MQSIFDFKCKKVEDLDTGRKRCARKTGPKRKKSCKYGLKKSSKVRPLPCKKKSGRKGKVGRPRRSCRK